MRDNYNNEQLNETLMVNRINVSYDNHFLSKPILLKSPKTQHRRSGVAKQKPNDILSLADSVFACKKCPELVKCRSRPVPGYGDASPYVLFIGEAPGRFGADVTGVPFTRDRSGRLFQKMLGHVGLTKSFPDEPFPVLHKAFVTNTVKCNPRDSEGRNRCPTENEIENCSRFLKEEIRLLSPKIIVPLGVLASRQIIGRNFESSQFGTEIEMDNVVVFPLWHPGYVIRGGGTLQITEKRYRHEFHKLKTILLRIQPDFVASSPGNLNDFFENSSEIYS